MANEATVTCYLQIVKDDGERVIMDYLSRPSAFLADVDGTKGPTPGAVTVHTTGKVIDLSQLTIPGLCRLMNMDDTNFVEYGIRDPGINVFYPLGELLPGETYIIRFTRNLLEEYTGTGTGTTAPGNQFFMKANGAACVVLIEAFEK